MPAALLERLSIRQRRLEIVFLRNRRSQSRTCAVAVSQMFTGVRDTAILMGARCVTAAT